MQSLALDDFTKYKFLSNVKHSPNGQYACFITHQADLDENGYQSNLWLYDVNREHYFQLTSLNKERSFIWLSNSEDILFSGLRNPQDQEKQKKGEQLTVFYRINIHGGEALEYFRVPLKVETIHELEQEKYLLTVTYNPNPATPEEKDYEVLEEIPYWSNGRGFVSGNRSRLYLYDKSTQNWEPLTGPELQVSSVQLNKSKTHAIIVGQEFIGKAELNNALYLADLAKKTVRQITPTEEFTYATAHFITDQQVIYKGTARDRYGLNENGRFYLVNLADGSKQLLTPEFETSTWNSVGSDCRYGGGEDVQVDQGFLYFLTTEGESSYLNRLNSQGKLEKVTSAGGSVDSYSVQNGQVLLIALRGLSLQELYRLQNEQEHMVTSFNTWVTENKKLAQPQPLSFETEPGVTIDGWVLQPVDYEEGKKYPAILNIHGGPKTVYGTVFFHEMQYWANQGYFVFFCNPRGSDGKGNDFSDIGGKYGTIDYEDLMRFTDHVLANYPQIDHERVGVTGGSYGGFMTNWIIGHTQRFRAAASQRSISNWVSMGFTTDIGYYFATDQIGATPWSNFDKLWEHSPLRYADRVRTPTLFIHSEEDYRCWLPEGLQMFSALKYHGVEARLCMFRGENHELSRSGRPKQRIRRLEEITAWFNRFLKDLS